MFDRFEEYINEIGGLPVSQLDEIIIENWAVRMFVEGFDGLFENNSNWKTAQLLVYMAAYWRRQNEEKEDRGFPGLPLEDFLSDYNAAEYIDIVPYSKYTLAEIIALGIQEVTAELTAAVTTVSADRRSQLDNNPSLLYKWVTAGDAKVCFECRQHEGEIVGRSELLRESNAWEYNASLGNVHSTVFPPLHPRCRCKLVPVISY